MQTYIFTVAVAGKDVQDAATKIHDDLINLLACNLAGEEYDDIDVHVTESVRLCASCAALRLAAPCLR